MNTYKIVKLVHPSTPSTCTSFMDFELWDFVPTHILVPDSIKFDVI